MSCFMSDFKKEIENEQKCHTVNSFSLKHWTMFFTLRIDQELKRGSTNFYKGNNDANAHLNIEDYIIINSGQL